MNLTKEEIHPKLPLLRTKKLEKKKCFPYLINFDEC